MTQKTYNGHSIDDLKVLYIQQSRRESNDCYGDALKAVAEACTPKWIPVEEKLPDIDSLVLVIDAGSGSQTTPEIGSIGGDTGVWRCDVCHLVVTHWMPLPEPPESL